LKKSDRLMRLLRHLASQQKRLQVLCHGTEAETRRVALLQSSLADAHSAAAQARPPGSNSAAWLRWRGSYLERTGWQCSRLAAKQEQLMIALAMQKKHLARRSGRQRAVQKLLVAVLSTEQRRAAALQQAETDQRAGVLRWEEGHRP